MSLAGKKIWIDAEEPKVGIMFKSLIRWFKDAGAELMITARDFDSTFQILDDTGFDYIKVGKHGGNTLKGKLRTYIERLNDLFPYVIQFNPDFFVTFGSVEGSRISMGLQIPSIGISDEPRSIFVSKQLFPAIDKLITADCIPIEDYIKLHADREKIIRYDGIDEIAWLSEYTPNPKILEDFGIEKGKFVLMRSEPSFASYFIHKLKPDETLLAEIFPPIFKKHSDYKYFLLVRTEEQEKWLREKLQQYSDNDQIVITRYLPNIVDLCFYAALVISGGGTIVRESALLGVPSIEFFPGETAPQEIFLSENGFPMQHLRKIKEIVDCSIKILEKGPTTDRFTLDFRKKIRKFENPNRICFEYVKEKLLN